MTSVLFVVVMIGVVPATRDALWVGLIRISLLALLFFGFIRGRGRQRHQLVDETAPITLPGA